MNSEKIIFLSSLMYPQGKLNSYLFESEKTTIIANAYQKDKTFIWNDTTDVLDPNYIPPEPFYKYVTRRTCRPFIPLSQKEVNYLIEHQKELQICKCITEIKQYLKSRNFNAAKQLLPLLGKLNKQDYSTYAYEECPSCILLRLFNIQ